MGCSNCTEPYELNGTDSSCFLCGEVWANCSECTSAGCTNCSVPYILDSSNLCFLCWEKWTNCSECSATVCTNCSDPYLLRVGGWAGTQCLSCQQVHGSECLTCNDTECLSCIDNYVVDAYSSGCVPCGVRWTHCVLCN